MLDTWIDGQFNKRSAEAPINIFQSTNIDYSLGGIGNLSVNLKALKVKHTLLTEIGKDLVGDNIITQLKKKNIRFKASRSNKISTSKERYYHNDKQIFRNDKEDISENLSGFNKIIDSIKKKRFSCNIRLQKRFN